MDLAGGSGAVAPAGITAGLFSGASTGCADAASNGGHGGNGGGGRGGHAIDVVFMATPTQVKLGPKATWI